MTRIIAGRYGGRRLSTPPGQGTRPTSDRVREALFNTLESMVDLSGAYVADLYAGSGAIGLEAASRGAAQVLLVESDQRAARTVRHNIATLGAGSVATLITARVQPTLAAGPPGAAADPARAGDLTVGYDVVFADPPYGASEAEVLAVLTGLVDGGWLAPDAVVVVERSSRSPELPSVTGVTAERSRRYGETVLWYGRRS